MARVLLIRTDRKLPAWLVSPPLGLMYLSAALKHSRPGKHEVELLDLRFFSQPRKRLERRVLEFHPDLVGISSLSSEAPMLGLVAETVKSLNPDCRVIAGGPHTTVFYDQVLENRNVDYTVIGEGEKSFVDLVDRLSSGGEIEPLPGVAFQKGGELIFPGNREPIQDLDSLPFPDWDLLDLDAYLRVPDFSHHMGRGRYMGLFTSRACPFQCAYCHSIFGKSFRARSPENVLNEMKILRDEYRVREYQFFDDCFNFQRERAREIGERIAAEVPGAGLSFPNAVRGDLVDRDFLEVFRRAGAYAITFAVETASPRIQKLIRKNLHLEKVRAAIVHADELGYFVQGFFMIGFPTETVEEIKQTIDFAVKSPLSAATFFIVVPYARTELLKLFEKEGFSGSVEFKDCHYRSEKSVYSILTGLDLSRVQKKAYLRFYLNPYRLIKSIFRVPNKKGYFTNLIRFGFQALLG